MPSASSVILFSTVYLIPVGISFDSAHLHIHVFTLSLTGIYFLDAMLNMCKLTTKEGTPVPARTSMLRYLYRNGLIDLITVLPFGVIFTSIDSQHGNLAYLLRLIRLQRLGTIVMTNPVYGGISSWMQTTLGVGGSFMSVWLFGGLLLVYLHLYACGLFLAGKLTEFASWTHPEPQAVLTKDFGAQYTWAVFVAIANTFPITGFR